MAKECKELFLSPSLVHKQLAGKSDLRLSYAGGDFKKWQMKLRKKLKELVGEMPSERPPLNVRNIWERENHFGNIQKIVFTAEKRSDVLAYVCIPKNTKPPYDFMICLQGHSTGMHNSIAVDINDETKKIKVPGDRDFALGCMKRGVAALCIEQRAFGERKEKEQKQRAPHPCHDAAMHALMLGRTLIGERVYDVDRGIDYLKTRKDVNFKTLGVMGNSGGGTISLFSAALLPRIKFAMPSCYFCTFKDSIMDIYHCADNYIPNLLAYAEMYDVMGLFAPNPVVIVAGEKDKIFPVEGVRKAFWKLKTIYKAAGARDNCHLVVGKQGHRFYARQAWPFALKEIEKLKNGRVL
jgi:dienelactone hydrolase